MESDDREDDEEIRAKIYRKDVKIEKNHQIKKDKSKNGHRDQIDALID